MSKTEVDVEKIILLNQTKSNQLVNPVLQIIVDGVCDENCLLSMFVAFPHIIQNIWDNVTSYWRSLITEPLDPIYRSFRTPEHQVAFVQLGSDNINFPKPKDININMMPFVMEMTFEKCRLPKYLKSYWNHVINKIYYCGPYSHKLFNQEVGKIGYLTIHESYVNQNTSQRRAGLHTDCPGKVLVVKDKEGNHICIGSLTVDDEEEVLNNSDNEVRRVLCKESFKHTHWSHPWGTGMSSHQHELIGGIYMASTVSNSCRVWDCRILQDENKEEIIGNLGDVEHLREFLTQSEMMEENTMYWITDRTPHESLPLEKPSYRQYFRLVTSEVGLWYEEHSTKNPLGVVPDPAITTIVKGSKFNKRNLLLSDLTPEEKPPGEADQIKRDKRKKPKEVKKSECTAS